MDGRKERMMFRMSSPRRAKQEESSRAAEDEAGDGARSAPAIVASASSFSAPHFGPPLPSSSSGWPEVSIAGSGFFGFGARASSPLPDKAKAVESERREERLLPLPLPLRPPPRRALSLPAEMLSRSSVSNLLPPSGLAAIAPLTSKSPRGTRSITGDNSDLTSFTSSPSFSSLFLVLTLTLTLALSSSLSSSLLSFSFLAVALPLPSATPLATPSTLPSVEASEGAVPDAGDDASPLFPLTDIASVFSPVATIRHRNPSAFSFSTFSGVSRFCFFPVTIHA
mmetsp:Transcript_6068/g.17766  ORF Transcript_6068/g.17766 Transcript_6068/m.17766 type:complete len:282 (-) Transcript_6068:405-1250(-)